MRRCPDAVPQGYRSGVIVWLAILGVLSGAIPARSVASDHRRTATVKVVERARGSIVNIHGQKVLNPGDEGYRQGETPQRVNGMGTGVVIDERGYIITNHHVVEGVKRIQVSLAGGENFTATLVSHDPATDLAIIKVDVKESLPVITIGTSTDLMPGEPVIAVGNAYGYEHTVTRGIISALHRTVQVSDAQNYRDLIQTDASINPGNSGGPLLNIDGEMIGINVAVRAGAQGIGFAIPVDMAMDVAAKLMSTSRIEHTWHGVVCTAEESPQKRQVIVAQIDENSPAAKSGLRPGDVITSVGDRPVARVLDFERALLGHKTGERIPLSIKRKQQSVSVNLVLATAPAQKAPPVTDQIWEVLGMRLEPIAARQFRQNQSRYRGGLSVSEVKPDSAAARQGIRRGDVLVGMHVWETVSLDNVSYILNRPDFGEIEPLKFYILRGNETLYGHLPVSLQR